MRKINFDKKSFSLAIYVLLIVSSTQPFISFNSLVSMYTFEVKGYFLVSTAFIFLIYSIFTKKKLMYFFSTSFVFAGYFYTFYTLFYVHHLSKLSFMFGFYLYILSFVLFIILLFLKFDAEIESEPSNLLKNIKPDLKNNNLDNKYIIGTYLYGIKGKPEFSNHYCAVTTDNSSKNLIIFVASDTAYKYEIKYEKIEKITVRQSLTMNNGSSKMKNDYTTEKMMLGYALAGIWGSMLAENLSNSHDSITYSSVFTVEIIYNNGEETKKFVMEFPRNPDYFFNNYSNLYEKIS